MEPVVIVIVGSVVAGGYAVHRLALYADRRGWVYYKTKPKVRGTTLGLLDEIYNPAMTHVIDEQQHERTVADHDASGDPPETDRVRPTPE